MFVPMPLPPPSVVAQHFYNKHEKLDPEAEHNQFVASEGTYKAIEQVSIAYPAAHPSELAPNPNPLTPYAGPLHSGMHLSVVSLAGTRYQRAAIRTPSQGDAAIPEHVESQWKDDTVDDSSSSTEEDSGEYAIASQPATPAVNNTEFQRANSSSTGGEMSTSMLSTNGNSVFDSTYDRNAKRRKRLGTSANGTTSTFISRAITDPTLANRLLEHKNEDYFLFANVSRSLSWLDLGAATPLKQEPLSKLMFSLATVVCHDVNPLTCSTRGLDIIIGTNTGDICWYDPASSRYLRYNKQRCINPSAVTHIQWLPESECLFMAAHADGSIVIYDKDREDADFVTTLPTASHASEHEYFPQTPEANPALSVLKSAHDNRVKTNPVSYLHCPGRPSTLLHSAPIKSISLWCRMTGV